MAKARYKTKQMTELHTFLQSVQGQHVTVQEIKRNTSKTVKLQSERQQYTGSWKRW